MLYQIIAELGSGDDSLPRQARDIYEEVYNSAWEHYQHEATRRDNSSQEEIAHRLAWAAVEQLYQKDKTTGHWLKNQSRDETAYDTKEQIINQNFH